MDAFLRVAAYQGPAIEGNPEKAFQKILEVTSRSHTDHIDILCFSECFLHGYFEEEKRARQHSLDLESAEFQGLLNSLKDFTPAVIFGLNERKNDQIYNTAVLIENGILKGVYRKQKAYAPYEYYSCGQDLPIFEIKGIKVGILICYDTTFLEPARILARKGARILFVPSFNRVSNTSKMPRYLDQRNHLVARSGENDCWVVVSDITWEEGDGYHCPGYSCVFNSDGERVAQSLSYQEMVIQYDIPFNVLENVRHKRFQRG
ncbi:MAG: carbon-nitrogen hydrolase family protein [bacterium]|nr:carbon-nitrogen hydrolase family protein [bacterium]